MKHKHSEATTLQTKNMHERLIYDFQMSVGVKVSL